MAGLPIAPRERVLSALVSVFVPTHAHATDRLATGLELQLDCLLLQVQPVPMRVHILLRRL